MYLFKTSYDIHNLQLCGSRKYPSPSPWKVIGNSEGEGVSTAKIYKGNYEAKLEIPGREGGFKWKKSFSWGGMDILWNHTLNFDHFTGSGISAFIPRMDYTYTDFRRMHLFCNGYPIFRYFYSNCALVGFRVQTAVTAVWKNIKWKKMQKIILHPF